MVYTQNGDERHAYTRGTPYIWLRASPIETPGPLTSQARWCGEKMEFMPWSGGTRGAPKRHVANSISAPKCEFDLEAAPL